MDARFNFGRFLAVALFCATMLVGGETWSRTIAGEGRLIVQRSGNFGLELGLRVWIDGRDMGTVTQNRLYNHLLPAGRHVITATSVPNIRNYPPASAALTVQPGETYIFTALWLQEGGLVLRRAQFVQ